ncbi:MAG TPA: HAD family phosphatase [Patescibacteria group bacterium]|nr:HAD family phosphatase [Patescibacteria group bacterium]
MRAIKAVLFDLDGVLIDSEPVWERVRSDYVQRLGARWNHDVQRRMMGVSTDVWARTLSDLLGGALSPDEVARGVIDAMALEYRRDLPMISGAAGVVRELAAVIPLGIASGSPRTLIELVLDRSGLAACFQATLSTDEISRGKPAPDAYVELARRLGFEAAECAAVEDSTNGLKSALAAGATVIAVPPPSNMPDPATLAGAHVVVDHIGRITPALIGGLGA